jgi:arginyl-tRNA synthetase
VEPLDAERAFREGLRRAATRALGSEPERIVITYPPRVELGDLATPVCFELAKALRRAPRELAREVVAAFEPTGGIERVEAADAGYVNAFLDRERFLRASLGGTFRRSPGSGPKVIVEHTNINPNKAAHIGHLRNAVLGDTLVRCLRRLGRPVEVQNYIDDTGVQVADLVVGFRVLRDEGLAEVRERYSEQRLHERDERFDFIAWDLYAEVTRFYGEDAARLHRREETLQAMEAGDNPIAELARFVARRMVRHHLLTMERIGVRYDLLPWESDILALRFWDTAFGRLRESGAIRMQEQGKHAGCWVMQLADAQEGAGEDEKVIVRSNGTVTYVGKDIAYQLWKFGLLGRDFEYAPFGGERAGLPYGVWSTCSSDGAAEHPAFGRGDTVYNVIDRRQSYLQRVVTQGLRALGHAEQADRSIHYAYEMVALTPAAVQALFPDYPLSDADRARPHLEMSGRRGLGIRADDLLDALLERAREEILERHPEMDAEEVRTTARQIMVGALRYYMLRFSRNRVVAFDLDAALAFEGETGPYLQYSVVRASNILGKVAERFGADAVDAASLARGASLRSLGSEAAAEHWNLVLQLLRVDAVVEQAVETLELSAVAKHAHVLAQAFNTFYHRYPVVQEPDAQLRAARTAVVRVYRDGMVGLLDLMGVGAPARM